jgi:hypothetical protein
VTFRSFGFDGPLRAGPSPERYCNTDANRTAVRLRRSARGLRAAPFLARGRVLGVAPRAVVPRDSSARATPL